MGWVGGQSIRGVGGLLTFFYPIAIAHTFWIFIYTPPLLLFFRFHIYYRKLSLPG